MRHLVSCGVVACLSLAAPMASAFKPEQHKIFSRIALMTDCVKAALTSDDDRQSIAAAFPQGADNEDSAISTLLSRMRNWHYAKNRLMADTTWFLAIKVPYSDLHFHVPIPFPWKTNLDDVFEKRVEDLHAAAESGGQCSAGDIFEKAGRVTHYLQDMRVPAHVLPVDHGFPFAGDDDFDHGLLVTFDLGKVKAACAATTESALRTSRSQIAWRLARARRATLAWLSGPAIKDGVRVEACRWDRVFWCNPRMATCPKAHYAGFGSYADDHAGWGASRARCGGLEGDVDYSAAQPGYDDMMEDTVFMALYAKALLDRCRDCR